MQIIEDSVTYSIFFAERMGQYIGIIAKACYIWCEIRYTFIGRYIYGFVSTT